MSVSPDLISLWPAAGLRARAGGLELRWIDDELLLRLARLAGEGVHDPARMPFNVPWTVGTPDEVARSVLAFQWGARAQVGPGRLVLELAVLDDGEPVGIQGLSGDDWAQLRTVETGSWLGRRFQGRGIGTRMRALMLELCFAGLDADEVISSAFADNAPSRAVSTRVGYLPNGIRPALRHGERTLQHHFRLTRDRWSEVRAANAHLLGAPATFEGLAALRAAIDAPAT